MSILHIIILDFIMLLCCIGQHEMHDNMTGFCNVTHECVKLNIMWEMNEIKVTGVGRNFIYLYVLGRSCLLSGVYYCYC